jgi:hypothetical protein
MFPLSKRKVIRGAKEHVAAGLGIAVDYEADHIPYLVPADGTVYKFGSLLDKGGYWLGIKLNKPLSTITGREAVKIEVAHLSKYLKSGNVKEGETIAITGNTGTLTTGPHAHIQAFDKSGNRIDPETIIWNPVTYPIKINIKLVINDTPWTTLGEKIAAIESWYSLNSGGKLQLQFTSSYSNFSNIPFKVLPDGSAVIDEQWFDANVLDHFVDTTILVVRDVDLPDNFPGGFKLVARTLGFMGKRPTKTIVACSETDQSEIYPALNAFVDYIRHELMHSCYLFSGEFKDGQYYGLDYTHKYFYDLKNPENAFTQLNYENINKTLMAQNQAKIVKSKKSSTVYICYPVPSEAHLKERASLEGIEIPAAIPNSDSL